MSTPERLLALCPDRLGPHSQSSYILAPHGALIYARVSTLTEQQQDGSSIENQIEKCRQWAESKNLPIKLILYDMGISGKDPKRPALLHLYAKAEKGDTLIVHSLSRISRGDLRTALNTVGELQDRGVSCRCLDEGADTTTPYGIAFQGVQRVFAELERNVVVSRVKEGIAKHKQLQGPLFGRHERFGYRWKNPEGGGGLEPYEPEHAVVRALCTYYTDGHSVDDCTKKAYELWPERGWSMGTMSLLLRKEGVEMRKRGRPSIVCSQSKA